MITQSRGGLDIGQTPRKGIDPALAGMALGRIVLGIVGLAAPDALARLFRLRPSPDLDYMNRVFAGRAIALGIGYLTEPPGQRRRWQKLCLFVDSADTLAALEHLRRRDLPLSAVAATGAVTGSYVLIGAWRLGRAR